jgi:hypothetical protein
MPRPRKQFLPKSWTEQVILTSLPPYDRQPSALRIFPGRKEFLDPTVYEKNMSVKVKTEDPIRNLKIQGI